MVDGLPIIQFTPSVLLGFAILLLLTGRLVPRSFYQDKIKEAEQWKQAYEAERTARAVSDAQTRELLEVAKTSEAFLGAIYQKSTKLQSGEL